MSTKKLARLAVAFLLVTSPAAFGLSIRILPGGFPVLSPDQLLEEGIRLGSREILRKAWQDYEKAGTGEGTSREGYLQMGRIFFHLSMLDAITADDRRRAQGQAEDFLASNPDDPDAHHMMGLVLTGQGKHLDAVDELRLALHLKPGNEYILCDLAAIHLALHETEETIKLLEGKGLRNGWSYFILAMAWLQKGEKGRALLNLKKAHRVGFRGYWLDLALEKLGSDLDLPLR